MLQQAYFNTAAGATENRHRTVIYTLLISYNTAIKSSCSSKFCFHKFCYETYDNRRIVFQLPINGDLCTLSNLSLIYNILRHSVGAYFPAKTKGATEATPLKLPDSMNTCQISAVYASASKSSLTSDGSDISTLTIHPFPYGS